MTAGNFFRNLLGGRHGNASAPESSPVVKRDPATGCQTECYYFRGKLHRENDRPAMLEYDPESNRLIREQYFRHGKLHRENGPAFIEYAATTGKKVIEVFFENGKLRHGAGDGPAAIDYDPETGEAIQYDQSRPGSPPIKKRP